MEHPQTKTLIAHVTTKIYPMKDPSSRPMHDGSHRSLRSFPPLYRSPVAGVLRPVFVQRRIKQYQPSHPCRTALGDESFRLYKGSRPPLRGGVTGKREKVALNDQDRNHDYNNDAATVTMTKTTLPHLTSSMSRSSSKDLHLLFFTIVAAIVVNLVVNVFTRTFHPLI